MKKKLLPLLLLCTTSVFIFATKTTVVPGTKTIYDAVNAAVAGDTLIISDGEYVESSNVTITKSLVIQAADGAAPFIKNKRFEINVGDGDDVTIQGLTFDNTTNSDTEQVRVNSGTNNNLKFIDCIFQNSTSYGIRLYKTAVMIDTLLVSGCVFKDLQHVAIYSVNGGSSPGRFKHAEIENSTFVNVIHPKDKTYAIYLRDHDGNEGDDPTVLIDHCTFYNTAPESYVIYLHKISGATIQNCIVANDVDKKSSYAFYGYGTTSINNSIWYNCDNGARSGLTLTNVVNQDPQFINPTLLDFNFEASSPAAGNATDGSNIGDKRWGIKAAELGITITSPQTDTETSDIFKIQFVPSDPTGESTISLFYSLDNENWTLIVDDLASDIFFYDWNVRTFEAGSYYIKAVINDGIESKTSIANGKVIVVPDIIPPRNPRNMDGEFVAGKVVLSWENPTREVPVNTPVEDFESGIGNFIETKSGADGSFSIVEGYEGDGLKVNFDIAVAWKEYGVKVYFDTPINYTNNLEFWYKGDGSSNKIRLIIEQADGDWWYTEEVSLNSTSWKQAQLDLNTFKVLSWHTNIKSKFDFMNVSALNFIVSSGVITTGNFTIDNIVFSGNIPSSPDFEGTKIVKRTDRFPADHTDGELIYDGALEIFEDEDIQQNQIYYYAAFAYDDLDNHSSFYEEASFQYDGNLSSIFNILNSNNEFRVTPTLIKDQAEICIQLEQSKTINIGLYNTVGHLVLEFINLNLSSGDHTIPLTISNLPNGVYYVQYKTSEFAAIRKILVQK